MEIIKREVFNRSVLDGEVYHFEILSNGLYLVAIRARCKNWIQNFKKLFNDDDLAIEIDGVPFYEGAGKYKEFNSPASWNGNVEKNISKIVFFILPFASKSHELRFITDGLPFLEVIEIYSLGGQDVSLSLVLPKSTEGKLFLDIVFKNLELSGLSIKASANSDGNLKLLADKNKYEWFGKKLRGNSDSFNINQVDNLVFQGTGEIVLEEIKFSLDSATFGKKAKVALSKDIVMSDKVNLRSEPSDDKDDTVIARLADGEELEILEERVFGGIVQDLSNIWHKVKYKALVGYIISSYVEIEGQERQRIIQLIRIKAAEFKIDADLLLSIAGCESRYKPYAVSFSDKSTELDKSIAWGVFQLAHGALTDLNNPEKSFYSPVSDHFNVAQNIAGGVRYFKWLYEVNYKNSSKRLERSIAGYNAGPGAVSRSGVFSLKDYSLEVRQHQACTLENIKIKKWQNISRSILVIFLIGIASVFPSFRIDSNSFDEFPSIVDMALLAPSHNEVYKFQNDKDFIFPPELTDAPIKTIRLSPDKSGIFINFFRENGNLVFGLPASRLALEEVFNAKFDEYNDRIILDQAVEVLPNIFYFTVTPNAFCGNHNCSWALFRYDFGKDVLTFVNKDLRHSVGFFLAPDKQKVALVENGGSCFGSGYLHILDLKTQIMTTTNKFLYHETSSVISSFKWLNNSEVEIKTVEDTCPYDATERIIRFNLDSQKSEVLSQRKLLP